LYADGQIHEKDVYELDVCVVNPTTLETSETFAEDVIVQPNHCLRLSGGAIRNHFYFATPAGNDLLVISKKKNSMRECTSCTLDLDS